MANYTRAQRAEREAQAALAAKPSALENTQAVENAAPPRETLESATSKPKLLDAKEYAEKILAKRKEFSGMEQKLAFEGDHLGWKHRWVNEENVEGRLQEGYRFVLRDEVNMSDSQRYGNEDTGDRVSKHAGRISGVPFKTYLMEIPNEIAALLDKEKSHNQIARYDHSIRSGQVGAPTGNNRVGAKDGLPEIKYS